MKFASTRSFSDQMSFEDAVFQGLAPDGGLYQPTSEPDLKDLLLGFDEQSSFTEIAAEATAALFSEEISRKDAFAIAEKAFPFKPELTSLSDDMTLLELYHGPSCAFKDFGASYLATVMEHFLRGKNKRAIILTATSGDTGSAVAQSFYKKDNIDVVILYPSGRVSPSQEKQLTTLGENIHALEINGSFDDCQRMVKEAFISPELSAEFPLTSANSINLGRLLPQSFYYMYAFAQLKNTIESELYFTVPSGNFGNLTAGVFAWRWGLPVNGFVAATNINDIVPSYLKSGIYSPRDSIHTYANAMDVGNPSNFERLQAIFHSDLEGMRTMIHGRVVNDETILSVMKRYKEEKGISLCPHTAIGVSSSEAFQKQKIANDGHIVTLATAHPAKFSEVCVKAGAGEPEMPQRLKDCMDKPKKALKLGNTLDDLKGFLRAELS